MTNETWKSLPEGFDPKYSVSNLGRVKRGQIFLDPYHLTSGRFRKTSAKSSGYYLRMSFDGKRPYWAVADLVLLAHVPDFDPTRHAVFFKDGDPSNPRLDNLSYARAEFRKIRKRIEALRKLAA